MTHPGPTPLLFIHQVGFVSVRLLLCKEILQRKKVFVPTMHPKKGRATEKETDPAAPSRNARSFQVPVWPLAAELPVRSVQLFVILSILSYSFDFLISRPEHPRTILITVEMEK